MGSRETEEFALGKMRLSWERVGCTARVVLSWKRGGLSCEGGIVLEEKGLSWARGVFPG